jgi:hypothetical protein
LFAARAPSTQLRTFFGFLENAADGPRMLPFQGAGEPPPSETLPAFFRADFSNTTGASALRASSSPIADGRGSLPSLIAAMAASAVLRSLAAMAAMGSPT